MMVRRDEFLALGGFYEPLFMYGEEADYCLRVPGRVVLHPDAAIRHDVGHAAGPARSLPRLYHPARNRLVNAARHLPPLRMARAVAASAAFDVLTLAQVRRGTRSAPSCAAGWRAARDPPRAARAPRPTSAARPRGGSSACARPWRSSVVWDACEPERRSPARRAAAGLPDAPAIHGRDRLHGVPGEFAVHVCPACGSGRTLPLVPTERLGALYPEGYNAYGLPDNPLLRAAATGLFRWRYWRALRRAPFAELLRRPPGRLLDVGCGRGDLGVTLASRGWRVTGSSRRRRRARRRGRAGWRPCRGR